MLCRLLSVRTEVRCRLVSDYVYEEHAWLEVQIFMKGTDEEARHLDEMIDTALTVRSALAVRPERSHTALISIFRQARRNLPAFRASCLRRIGE